MYREAPTAIPQVFKHSEHPTVEARIAQLNQWRKDVIIAHEMAMQRMKHWMSESFDTFMLGQKVWLEGLNLKLPYNKKISTKREEPFKIIEVLPPLNYHLQLPQGWKQYNMFHVGLLTPYRENETHGPNFT
jgi:hypothetical protein